jgi:Lrp/AsnC family leucine-responsive transcriptional regulator
VKYKEIALEELKGNNDPLAGLDELDRRILGLLQVDASLSNQELAQRVHASPPTCLRRVRRLRELGVIQGIVAILAPERVGSPLTVIVEVTLDVQTTEGLEAFENRVGNEPALVQCYRVSGGPDFVLVALAANMQAYQELARRVFNADSNVRNVRTFFSMHRSKFDVRAMV